MCALIVIPPSTYAPRSLADWTGWTESCPTWTSRSGMWWRRRAGAHQMNSVFGAFSYRLLLYIHPTRRRNTVTCWLEAGWRQSADTSRRPEYRQHTGGNADHARRSAAQDRKCTVQTAVVRGQSSEPIRNSELELVRWLHSIMPDALMTIGQVQELLRKDWDWV